MPSLPPHNGSNAVSTYSRFSADLGLAAQAWVKQPNPSVLQWTKGFAWLAVLTSEPLNTAGNPLRRRSVTPAKQMRHALRAAAAG